MLVGIPSDRQITELHNSCGGFMDVDSSMGFLVLYVKVVGENPVNLISG